MQGPPGWHSDGLERTIGPQDYDGLVITFHKSAGGKASVEVEIQGAVYRFSGPMPRDLSPRGLLVAITWTRGARIKCWIGAQQVGSRPFNPTSLN